MCLCEKLKRIKEENGWGKLWDLYDLFIENKDNVDIKYCCYNYIFSNGALSDIKKFFYIFKDNNNFIAFLKDNPKYIAILVALDLIRYFNYKQIKDIATDFLKHYNDVINYLKEATAPNFIERMELLNAIEDYEDDSPPKHATTLRQKYNKLTKEDLEYIKKKW